MATKKSLSIVLSCALLLSSTISPAWAIIHIPVRIGNAPVGGSAAGAAGAGNILAFEQITTQNPGALGVSLNGKLAGFDAPEVSVNPAQASAVLAAPTSVENHPVIGIINDLQKSGVPLQSMPKTAEEFAAFEEAIERNVPEGKGKRNLLAFAKSLSIGGGDASHLAQAYDGHGMRGGKYVMPVQEAARPSGGWNWLAQRKRGWFGLRKYAAQKAEESRKKAALIDKEALKVPVENLRWVPNTDELPGKLSELEGRPSGIIGQDRAMESIRFGLEMENGGYNLMVTGEDGTGRESAVRQELRKIAPTKETPPDLVAATNLADPSNPVVLTLPSGQGPVFQGAVRQVIGTLQQTLPGHLLSGEAAKQKEQMKDHFEKAQTEAMAKFEAEAAKVKEGRFGIKFVRQDETRFAVAVTVDGKLMSPEQVEKLIATEAEVGTADKITMEKMEAAQKAMSPKIKQLGKMLQAVMSSLAQLQGQIQQQTAKIDSQVVRQVIEQVAQTLVPFTRDSAHAAFAKRALDRQTAIEKDIAQTVVLGKFGLSMSIENGKLMAVPTWTDAGMAEKLKALGPLGAMVAGGAQEIGQEEFNQLKQAGQLPADMTWEAVMAAVLAKAKEFLPIYQAMGEANQKDQASLPAPTMESQKAKAYIKMLINHMAQNYRLFMPQRAENAEMAEHLEAYAPKKIYKVSVLAHNKPGSGAPVIFERKPSFQKLFGAGHDASQLAQKGGMTVKTQTPGGPTLEAGSYIKANGGYLVLDLKDVLREPGVYQNLMQMIRNKQAVISEGGIQSLYTMQGDHYGVPTEVKVVLIGSPYLKMMLSHHDEDFGGLFKAVAEFDRALTIGAEAIGGYLKFMRAMVEQSAGQILDFAQDAISGLFEAAAEAAESNHKLTAQFGAMRGLMVEASYWAKKAGHDTVTREDFDKMLSERAERRGGMRNRIKEMFTSDTFHVAIEGKEVGQINGLAVMGDFGVPSRITFENYVRPGANFLVSADQQAHSTGNSFDKSIANIKGFLGRTFGKKRSVPIEVSISFEQNYGGIDGDSATQTMIYGSLSTLSGVPIDQGIAITGSADQKGNVQVIGGVNHKIEGYFDVVKEKLAKEGREMTGAQGIIIPTGNVGDLTLRPDIVEAVKQGKFVIYAVDHVSQGVEILMGEPYSEVLKKVEARVSEVWASAGK